MTENGIIKDPRVEMAMTNVDRANYCPNNPYMDSPQGIGYAVTISAPHMVWHCVDISSQSFDCLSLTARPRSSASERSLI